MITDPGIGIYLSVLHDPLSFSFLSDQLCPNLLLQTPFMISSKSHYEFLKFLMAGYKKKRTNEIPKLHFHFLSFFLF